MSKKIILILIGIILITSGCSNESKSLRIENERLKTKISQLETDLINKNNEISNLENSPIKDLSINYIDNINKKMFVKEKCDILALPTENALILRPISENTVVNILDTAQVNGLIWLYVSIPVYDTPSNYKGWIKETNSVLYTKELISKVQSDVTIKEGEYMYPTYDFEEIKTVTPILSDEERGRIVEKKDGYVKMDCSGGNTIWVKETSIIYPDVD